MAKYATITVRRDSTLNWYAANPRLALGEIGVDMNRLRFKVGNGIDKWNELPYMNDDLYTTLDSRTQKITDQIISILETIKTNRTIAERDIASLGSRMVTLETRQSTYERNLTAQFTEAKDALDAGLLEFMETRDDLTTRMDVIVGSATEDTEILDARVDALYETHPNLGHNIRSLHTQILENSTKEAEAIENLAEQSHNEIIEFDEKLQRQINDNARANLQNAMSIHDEVEKRRGLEIEHEALHRDLTTESQEREIEDTRLAEKIARESAERQSQDEAIMQDLVEEAKSRTIADKNLHSQLDDEAQERLNTAQGLAKQANDNATANLRNTLKILDVDTKHKELLAREESARFSVDNDLQRQVDTNAEAGIQNAINIHQEANARRIADEKLEAEIEAEIINRQQHDNELAQTINAETQTRSQQDEAIKQEIHAEADSRISEDKALRAVIREVDSKLEDEARERLNADAGLAKQTNDNATANLQNALNILETNKRIQRYLRYETEQRTQRDDILQNQVDENSSAEIQNALNINHEAEQRRELSNKLNEEIYTRVNHDGELQIEIDEESFVRHKVDCALQEQITANDAERIEGDRSLQSQVDNTSSAALQNALAIRNEIEQRRQLLARLIEEKQDREHAIQNLFFEIGQLYEIPLPSLNSDLATLQNQADHNAQANISNALSIQAESNRRRENLSLAHEKIHATNEAIQEEFSQLYALGEAHQSQLDELANAVMQSVFNLLNEVSRRKKAINQEAAARSTQYERLGAQIDLIADGVIQNAFTLNKSNEKRRFEDLLERQSRHTEDGGLQEQIDTLSMALMQNSINNHNTRARIKKIEEENSTTRATNSEFSEMLDDVYNS